MRVAAMSASGLLLCVSALAMMAPAASATTSVTLYVSKATGTATTGCTSPGPGACKTITEGINAAEALTNSAVAVEVAPGTYDESLNLDVLNGDTLTIEGASASTTILDDGGSGSDVSTATASQPVTIDGLTVTGGDAPHGGGIYNGSQSTLTMDDDVISTNKGTDGVGIYQSGAIAVLDDDTFSGNVGALGIGAAVFNQSETSLTLDNDTFYDNSARTQGGAIYNGGTITAKNDTFFDNVIATGSGGAIFANGPTKLANSVLAKNTGKDCGGFRSVTDEGYNVADDTSCSFGSHSISGSSSIGTLSLAANGSTGPKTAAISASSSAWDEVPSSACTLDSDERGEPRPGAGDGSCDAGAFELQGATQTITFAGPGPGMFGGKATLSATGGASGNPVVFGVDPTSGAGVCAITGTTVSYTAAGTCVIDANQVGNATFNPAHQVIRSVTVSPLSQAISFTSTAPTNAVAGGATYTPTATGGASGNPVIFSIDPGSTAGTCTIRGGVVSFTAPGSCIIDANQAGDTDYLAAAQVTQNVTVAPAPSGYDLVGDDGGVFVFPTGQSGGFFGSLPGLKVSVDNIVGMVPTMNDQGYFLVGSDGGVFAFGNAPFENSLPGIHVSVDDIVGIVPTSNDDGYFLVGKDGGVFTFGNATFLGSLPSRGISVNNIIGIAANPSDTGYWLVAATGKVYSFGSATTFGSAPVSGSPVSAIESTTDGGGYWVVTQDGDVYSFGDAGKFGNLPALGVVPAHPVIGLVPTSDDEGYWLIGSDGGIFAFGNAGFVGSLPGLNVSVSNIVGAVPTRP